MSTQLKKKYHLVTTTEGCATNLVENASYGNFLETNGMLRTTDPSEADVIIVNTCAYTTDQEDRSVNVIEQFKKKYPNQEVIVGGCLTKIAPKRIEELKIKSSFNPGDIKTLGNQLNIENAKQSEDIPLVNFFDESDFGKLTLQHRLLLKARPIFFKTEKLIGKKFQPLHNIVESAIINKDYFAVTVSQGCAGKCTFCSIKIAKGHVKSRPIEIILHEIRTAISKGKKKIWLLGDDIGCYGIDRDSDFPTLLNEILLIEEDFQLIINYFEPFFFLKYFDKMKILLSDKRVINFNLPIQSGNKKVVYEMGREYDPSLVLKKLKELKQRAPALVVKTNIIVGFPDESFSEYLDSVKSIFSFDAILALKFTARPKTRAIKYENQLSETTKQFRIKFINILVFIRHAQVAIKSIFN
jgi:tRNA A37 methylthiotransferase MiaB